MTDYDDTNRGQIWPNEDKTAENPTWADFKGSVNVEGVEYWVSAWKRKPDANPKAPSLSFSIKRKETQQAPQPETAPAPVDDGFDDIPF